VGGRRAVVRALRVVERDALWAARVDWPAARERVLAALDDPAELQARLREVVRTAGGPHSDLVTAPEITEAASLPTARVVDGTGVLTLPACDRRAATRYVDAGERAYSRAPAGRWVVDLRGSADGTMWPVLAVAAPLLRVESTGTTVGHAGTVGYSVAPGRPGVPWRITAATVSAGRRPMARRIEPRALPGPVAVLTDGGTTGAGEAVAVAFRGLPDVRSFGAPTRGLSTANRTVQLPDGLVLLVTTARFADRTGRVYGAEVEPDVPVEDDALPAALDDVARR
jgi:carboxyl-terminal processing protease